MASLKEKMVKMEEEIETFSDLDKLRREAEEKRRSVLLVKLNSSVLKTFSSDSKAHMDSPNQISVER